MQSKEEFLSRIPHSKDNYEKWAKVYDYAVEVIKYAKNLGYNPGPLDARNYSGLNHSVIVYLYAKPGTYEVRFSTKGITVIPPDGDFHVCSNPHDVINLLTQPIDDSAVMSKVYDYIAYSQQPQSVKRLDPTHHTHFLLIQQ